MLFSFGLCDFFCFWCWDGWKADFVAGAALCELRSADTPEWPLPSLNFTLIWQQVYYIGMASFCSNWVALLNLTFGWPTNGIIDFNDPFLL